MITGLGITRYLACSMPNSTTQPVSMCRKPLHFQLVTNGRCVVSNEIGSSKRAGSKGQQPVKWHCNSDCKAVTETEVATIVHLKQAFEDVSHPIHTNIALHSILMTSTTPSYQHVHILPYICNTIHHNVHLHTH